MTHEAVAANQREQQKAETRRRLVEAATEVFLDSPPTTASLEEIAARGGVRRQTLLYHFGNRDGLMRAVVDHHLAAFRAQLRTFGGDLPSRLRAYLDAHKDPLVRLVRHLDVVAPDAPDSPFQGLWYPIIANDFEEQLLRAGVAPADARKRAPVLTLALLHMADRVATDRATDAEIEDFVTNAADIALA
jgi:AcrR family transcriptional regulator